jgi:uncharacterized membrane protein
MTIDPRTGRQSCAVFVPTAPNPTTGFVLIIDYADLVELAWSVEEAVRVIMSGGVLLPDAPPTGPGRDRPQPAERRREEQETAR